jgi:cytoskeleton protein RodZ
MRAGRGQLSLSFTGESWVEVVDAGGKSVIDRTFVDGQSEEVVARVPVMVVIGNAPATRLVYNGNEIDLRPHTRVSVARVTLK